MRRAESGGEGCKSVTVLERRIDPERSSVGGVQKHDHVCVGVEVSSILACQGVNRYGPWLMGSWQNLSHVRPLLGNTWKMCSCCAANILAHQSRH